MDTTILDLLDESSRIQAFTSCFTKLESSSRLDLDALRLCIKLRPRPKPVSKEDYHENNARFGNPTTPYQDRDQADASRRDFEGYMFVEKLCDLLVLRIPLEQLDSDHFYVLADILCSDGPFTNMLFREKIHPNLVALLPILYESSHRGAGEIDEVEGAIQHSVRRAAAYLTLLKCSYWLPSNYYHVIEPSSLEFLSRFIGLSAVEDVAHDAVSAFFSLLKRREPIVVAPPRNASQSWLKFDSTLGRVILAGSIIDGSLWDRLSMLELKDYTIGMNSSKVFRTWFQWISQAVVDEVRLACLQEALYWDRLRVGLLHGHADQRKYCIGIIRQSLLAAHGEINTPTMQFRVAERAMYLGAYEQYSALFETIVLDRYANQVQACLPELTKVFTSGITPLMASTLLSAALNPMVQDGVRKIIGNWYIEYVTKVGGDIGGHINFLLKGFLPWATLGELFTSTLISTRETTVSTHGALLADVVAQFVSATPDIPDSVPSAISNATEVSLDSSRRAIILGILDFILDARGKIFQFSILYLLEGIVKGLRACHDKLALHEHLTHTEIDKVSRISRLPGLPELAGDLYSEYCCQILNLTSPGWIDFDTPPCQQMLAQVQRLTAPIESDNTMRDFVSVSDNSMPLQALRQQLEVSKHRCIQGESYAPMCKGLINILDRANPSSVMGADLYAVLDAFWEEADRRQFCRPVAVHIPSLLFHPTCAQIYIMQRQSNKMEETLEHDLHVLLSKAVDRLQRLSEGRTYILSNLATSIRKAALSCPELIDIIPLERYILRFLNNPPTIKPEFLFEVAAAEKLQQFHPHRTYHSYYGQREWHAYAAMIDLIQRLPENQVSLAQRLLNHLLEPWKCQRPGIPIISKWKNVLQLQAMLLLVDFCIKESDADTYLTSFKHALILEAWPRYRFLLEWIIARIYYRFPGKTLDILDDLSKLDESSSTHIASLMKLAVLVAPREAENFSATFMTQLVPFSASPKVQIRHESNYAIPIIFDLALARGWKSITQNPAFLSLNAFIRSLEKFQSTPWTIRTLKLDAVKDFTLVNIFQGRYLTIESPEKARVAYDDFVALQEADRMSDLNVPHERIPLDESTHAELVVGRQAIKATTQLVAGTTSETSPAFFQTKSGFDMDSLHPQPGPPGAQTRSPASVVLVASLIDNPTNLGGLSRISESFGLEALYIDDLKQTAHKDFKATSVTSEKHLPIRQLKLAGVPEFLIVMKRRGYEVVGIEQTDRSGILGTELVDDIEAKGLGILPKKCVLVLGSEKGGISAEVLAAVDRCVEIRTVGVTRSLNVQTAGGIALYEWWREWYGVV